MHSRPGAHGAGHKSPGLGLFRTFAHLFPAPVHRQLLCSLLVTKALPHLCLAAPDPEDQLAPHTQTPQRGIWPSLNHFSIAGPKSNWSERSWCVAEIATGPTMSLEGKRRGLGRGGIPPKCLQHSWQLLITHPSLGT